jgi:hypothetical protein
MLSCAGSRSPPLRRDPLKSAPSSPTENVVNPFMLIDDARVDKRALPFVEKLPRASPCRRGPARPRCGRDGQESRAPAECLARQVHSHRVVSNSLVEMLRVTRSLRRQSMAVVSRSYCGVLDKSMRPQAAALRSAQKKRPLTFASGPRLSRKTQASGILYPLRRRPSSASIPSPLSNAATFGSGMAVMVTKLLPVRSLV